MVRFQWRDMCWNNIHWSDFSSNDIAVRGKGVVGRVTNVCGARGVRMHGNDVRVFVAGCVCVGV